MEAAVIAAGQQMEEQADAPEHHHLIRSCSLHRPCLVSFQQQLGLQISTMLYHVECLPDPPSFLPTSAL